MSPRTRIWLIPLFLYALFFGWYTDLRGPLTDREISAFLLAMQVRGSSPEMLENIERFMREDSGRQFLMLNIVKYDENPPDVEGANPGESARDLMGRYMAYMFPELLKRACHPTFMGPAIFSAIDVVGMENARAWDMGALMRYQSRRSFMEIVANPAQRDSHLFKVAALDKTLAFPIEPRLYLSDPRLILALLLVAITALLDGWRLSRRANG